MNAEVFLNSHIGDRYRRGAAGPNVWDCRTLTSYTQDVVFGRCLPIVLLNDASSLASLRQLFKDPANKTGWTVRPEGEPPAEGDIVVMTKAEEEHHLGTWFAFDRGGVFHAVERNGVCYDSLLHLQSQGWRRFRFYRWTGA